MPSQEMQRTLNELEPRVVDRLQKHRDGQTVEELAAHLRALPSLILSVLYMLMAEGHAYVDPTGVWTLRLPPIKADES
jgi:hypothetical protein